jgi:protocatechuate 3,4-dioxygenase beta subunit
MLKGVDPVPNPPTSLSPRTVASTQITADVLASIADTDDTRLKEVLAALVRHVHDFAREVELTPTELLGAAEFLRHCGEVSDAARHEFILLSDVLGLTMVVETLSTVPDGALETSVLGPFYRAGAPIRPRGADLSSGDDDGEPAHVSGRVLDTEGLPIAGAELDIWGTNHRGLYENVDPAQPDFNLRGRFVTAADGSFDFWTVRPVSYPIPDDGPVGDLLRATGRHNMRPGHLHVIASADGYRTIVTELFTDGDPYLDSDAVFGVKPSLIVDYSWADGPSELAYLGFGQPHWELRHDLVLTRGERVAVGFTTAAHSA